MVLVPRILLILLCIASGCDRSDGDVSILNIIGGREISSHQPWFVQIIDGPNSPHGYCGGALVGRRVVLTAAHCIEPQYLTSMFVVLGMADGVNLHLKKPVKVQAAIVHPGYHPEGEDPGQNDIAVLHLEEYNDDQFELPIAPIEMQQPGERIESLTDVVRVIGLGNVSSLGWLSDTHIREVDLPVLHLSKCAERYKNIAASQICAGEIKIGGMDSCQGDSGGPLMFRDTGGHWILAGIVSFGEGCAQKNIPGVYTRVASYIPWIQESIQTLTRPIPDTLTSPVVSDLLRTRCLTQFDYLPQISTLGEHSRQTIFGIERSEFRLLEIGEEQSGVELAQCTVEVPLQSIVAKWMMVKSGDDTGSHEVIVVVSVGDKVWVSVPQRLDYRQDRLTCQTAHGPIVLLDQAGTPSIQYRNVLYQLEEQIAAPDNSQVTWGCAVGDASVEIFEDQSLGYPRLATRILHKQVGAVVATLKKIDQQLMVDAEIIWQDDHNSILLVRNDSDFDIFTWRLVCPSRFSVQLKDGAEIAAQSISDGVGYGIVFDAALLSEGRIEAEESMSLGLRGERGKISNCLINDIISVNSSPFVTSSNYGETRPIVPFF
jgi:hypothetical protein